MTVFKTLERSAAIFCVIVFSACTKAVPPAEISDPYEAQNRSVHNFNKAVDRAVIRPAARLYGRVVPPKPATAINNFAFNFSEPKNVVNNILQLRLARAMDAAIRFVVNTTVGLAGTIDVAAKAGLEGKTTDFGETLFIWGVAEGSYVELPLVGPSTTRHTVGRAVDLFLNPLSYVLPVPENYYGTITSLAYALDTREEFAGTVNDILDNSVDSYSQAQILYLQSRRHKLGAEAEDTVIDPFAELGLE